VNKDGNKTDRSLDVALLSLLAILMVLALVSGGWGAERSAGQVVDDARIAMSVKGKLVADRPANLTRVNVKVLNRIVTLDGVVDTAEQKAHAEEMARRTDGVQQVVNNIQVSPQPSAQPR